MIENWQPDGRLAHKWLRKIITSSWILPEVFRLLMEDSLMQDAKEMEDPDKTIGDLVGYTC